VGRVMRLAIALLTPGPRLGIEVVQIGETHARPEMVCIVLLLSIGRLIAV
jgi:hypothetical protein